MSAIVKGTTVNFDEIMTCEDVDKLRDHVVSMGYAYYDTRSYYASKAIRLMIRPLKSDGRTEVNIYACTELLVWRSAAAVVLALGKQEAQD